MNNLTVEDSQKLELLKDLNQNETRMLVEVLQKFQKLDRNRSTPNEGEQLVANLMGKTYSHQDRVSLELQSLVAYFKKRRELLSNSFSSTEVMTILGTSRQTPHDRVKAKSLLAIRENGSLRFPAVQFDPEGPDGVVDGLPEVLKALHICDLAKLSWLIASNPILDGMTPISALKAGQKQRVLNQANLLAISQW